MLSQTLDETCDHPWTNPCYLWTAGVLMKKIGSKVSWSASTTTMPKRPDTDEAASLWSPQLHPVVEVGKHTAACGSCQQCSALHGHAFDMAQHQPHTVHAGSVQPLEAWLRQAVRTQLAATHNLPPSTASDRSTHGLVDCLALQDSGPQGLLGTCHNRPTVCTA